MGPLWSLGLHACGCQHRADHNGHWGHLAPTATLRRFILPFSLPTPQNWPSFWRKKSAVSAFLRLVSWKVAPALPLHLMYSGMLRYPTWNAQGHPHVQRLVRYVQYIAPMHKHTHALLPTPTWHCTRPFTCIRLFPHCVSAPPSTAHPLPLLLRALGL